MPCSCFVKVTLLRLLPATVWGMTGGTPATAPIEAVGPVTAIDPTASVVQTLAEGAIGEAMVDLTEEQQAEEEKNEKLAGLIDMESDAFIS